MKKYSLIRLLLTLFLIAIPIFSNTSCQSNISTSDCSFKRFSTLDEEYDFLFAKEQPDFIFEYPGCYKFFYPEIPVKKDLTTLGFLKDVEDDTKSSLIQVSVKALEGTNTNSNVSTAIEAFLIDAKNNKRFDNYSLVERKSVLINSINGESASMLVHVRADKYYPPMEDIIRQVNFEREGYLWEIFLNCPYEDVSQNMLYFEHLLNTFKIIENTP